MKTNLRTVLGFVSLLACCLATTAAAQQMPPAPVVVAVARQLPLAAGQTFVATIRPLKQAVIGSAVDGRVIELLAHEGQRVKKKQPLAQLLTATIELELQAAEATLELRTQELAELVNGTRPGEVEQAKAKMLGAKANMEFRRVRRERLEELRKGGSRAVSQDELDGAIAAAIDSEQIYFDLKAAYELAVEGPRPERIAQARAQMATQQALVDQTKDRIKKYTIISRFDGYAVAEYVETGAWVKTGDPVFDVVALDEVEVEAYVGEQDVPYINLGMEVRVEVPALPKRIFTGVVTKIIPRADMRSRTFPVKVRVANEIGRGGPLLKAGMVARVELPTGTPQEALMVPKDAIVLGGVKPMVYVVETADGKSGKAAPMPIQLGVAQGSLIQVKGPLQAGQYVVVEGNERLRPGQEVVIARVNEPALAAAEQDNEQVK